MKSNEPSKDAVEAAKEVIAAYEAYQEAIRIMTASAPASAASQKQGLLEETLLAAKVQRLRQMLQALDNQRPAGD